MFYYEKRLMLLLVTNIHGSSRGMLHWGQGSTLFHVHFGCFRSLSLQLPLSTLCFTVGHLPSCQSHVPEFGAIQMSLLDVSGERTPGYEGVPCLRIHLQPPQWLRPQSTGALTSGSILIQRMKRTAVMEHRTVFERPDVALNGAAGCAISLY